VQVHFVGQEAGQYYIVMELLKGRTLREVIEAGGPLDEEQALDIAIQIAEALRAAYRKEMIHGDIKPANVFVTDDVGTKVLDFGLAKLANIEVQHGTEVWGSPYYISPERVGRKAEDFRSDVYSLGATLFHALAGRPPFDAENPEDLALKRLNEKPPLLRELNSNTTLKTEQVINKMLNKSLMLRYRDYDALIQDLRDAKTEATAKRLGVDLHPEIPKPPEPVAPPPPQRSLMPLVLVGAVVLVAAMAAFYFWTKPKPPAPTPVPQAPITPTEPAPTPVPPTPPPTPPAPEPTPTPTPPPTSGRLWSVEFSIHAPEAQQVFVAGEFNNWDPNATPLRKKANGDWFVNLQLRTGVYAYKFIVDGTWKPDPDNKDQVNDNRGGFNSVLRVGP
jgi:serine/threonine protein kinase